MFCDVSGKNFILQKIFYIIQFFRVLNLYVVKNMIRYLMLLTLDDVCKMFI